ncbi:hypothetical protein NOR51B_1001 [Luminiphilus syltensis NOR5-1B]|uniref:Uncharacterized protein n=1 Tax=Luminiphilus syltensis NOR5-1B TaxID=565045 RepID=B8KSG5_9GAMM|nr:hypothetical protein NOR51B_1001 [Luminiphilus syltensis NOR5-1B]
MKFAITECGAFKTVPDESPWNSMTTLQRHGFLLGVRG